MREFSTALTAVLDPLVEMLSPIAAHPSYHLIRGHQRPPLKTSAADSEPLNDPSHLGGLRAGSRCGHRGGDGLPDRRALGEARLGDQAEVPWRV